MRVAVVIAALSALVSFALIATENYAAGALVASVGALVWHGLRRRRPA